MDIFGDGERSSELFIAELGEGNSDGDAPKIVETAVVAGVIDDVPCAAAAHAHEQTRASMTSHLPLACLSVAMAQRQRKNGC